MSHISGQSTADPDLPVSMIRVSATQPKGDLTAPTVEPLTPCTGNHHSLQDTQSPERIATAACSVLRLLRLPLLLDNILRNIDGGEPLSQGLQSALSQRSIRERQLMRRFASDLCCACDNLLSEDPSLADEDIEMEHGQAHQQKQKAEAVVEDRAELEPSMETPTPVCLAPIADKNHGTLHKSCGKVTSSDAQAHAGHNAAVQSDLQETEKSGRQLSDTEVIEDMIGSDSEAFCTATFKPSRPVGKSMCSHLGNEDSSTLATKTVTRATSPKTTPSMEPMTPERTPSQPTFREATILTSPKDDCLLNQAIVDFIRHSYEQVRRLSLMDNSQETYKALFELLLTHATQIDREQEDKALWSDGLQWVSLLEAGYKERQKGTVAYALTAISFARWHASEVQLIDGATTKGAAQEPQLDKLIRELLDNPGKMTVLRLMEDQMALFLDIGKTDLSKFRRDLESEGLPLSSSLPPPRRGELDDLCTLVQEPIDGDRLLIVGTGLEFGIESIYKLGGTTWLNDEVILACLHLSDRLPFVRVGFSIPVHRQTEAHGLISRPFETAADQLADWHSRTEEESRLVCFFPILSHEEHFSLLEINERKGCIFHYDSQSKGEYRDIKKACEKEFPYYQFLEEPALQQNDGHNCGPLVIKHARSRMLNLPVMPRSAETYDACELRSEAVQILRTAWDGGALVAAPKPGKRKRGVRVKRQAERQAKRREGGTFIPSDE
ncbi:hypothetical protein FSARC_11372 [Fusarium sarcochroum]|uniref:Ubiquitin-like protease family profile domain-containing protein n=1 Tax=Fusarium sarcochroum TaxID=1208366 RepID=A0A8H4TFS8_9HYPO|nr:hypothetical protein FSARC_11372 [Fusarium sarcochroum]